MSTPTYVPLGSVTLTGASSFVDFASIPPQYKDLILVASGRVSDYDILTLQFNGDTGSNYRYVYMVDTNSSQGTANRAWFGRFSSGAGKTSSSIAHILDYSSADKEKTLLGRGNSPDDSVWFFSSRWANLNPIVSIRILTAGGVNFQIGSTFSLFGVG